jgi:RNA polymerase sigma factor (TIGR02999 family)
MIHAWQAGDPEALNALMPHLYEDLQRLARRHMRNESSGHTLQATALVNEAFLRLADIEIAYTDRRHFLAMAARSMRRVLVDHARRRNSAKRGAGARDLTLDEARVGALEFNPAILDLDRSLARLAEIDQRLADAVELIFFGGLSYSEAADVLGRSKTGVHEDIQLAKAWLLKDMEETK